MIISASRRTDIPAFYSQWFYNRVKAGFVKTRNPRNFNQVREIDLAPAAVDEIVFWTKNPIPMLDRLNELDDYNCRFQFTITPYDKDLEPGLPPKAALLAAFRRLADKFGADRMVWRYDPILVNARYTADYHARAFGQMARQLQGAARKVTISFIDMAYRGAKTNIKELALTDFPPTAQIDLAVKLAGVAQDHGMTMDACATPLNLAPHGILSARCIEAIGFNAPKDKNQRPLCGCAASIDIGAYNTCKTGCRYCYANYNPKTVEGNFGRHNPLSPFLVD